MNKIKLVAAGSCVAVVLAGCGSTKTVAGPTRTVTDTATATVTTTATPVVRKVIATRTRTQTVTYTPPPMHTFTDGIYKVGEDIPSGEYRTDNEDSSDCYYEITDGPSSDNIIDNANLDGPGRLSVSKGQYLQVDGGCEWRAA